MKVQVATSNGDKIAMFDVGEHSDIRTLKMLIQQEFKIDIEAQVILFNSRAVDDSQTLSECGIVSGDVVVVSSKLEHDPLQDKVQPSSSSSSIKELIDKIYDSQSRAVNINNLDLEEQKRIEEQIRRENISNNLLGVMEYHPELFESVNMLYLEIEINKIPVKAFVDTGAQSSIISKDSAETCNMGHLIDTRYTGTAHGVGTVDIIGRIHNVSIKIGSDYFPCSFMVMPTVNTPIVLGLDMLARHRTCIDLKSRCLIVNEQKVPFLSREESAAIDKKHRELILKHNISKDRHESTVGSKPAIGRRLDSDPEGCDAPSTSGSTLCDIESKIKLLLDIGISRDLAINALESTGGDVDRAASLFL